MALLQKYLTIDNLYLHTYPKEDVYLLLIHVLSLPHTVDEVIRIFEVLVETRFEYSRKLDISRALALACQDIDTRLLERMLTSNHHWNPNLSYYYPYLNQISLRVLINNNKITLDEVTFYYALLGSNDLLVALLDYDFTKVSCHLETAGLGSWEWISQVITKHPVTKANLDTIVNLYGPEVLIKESN